MKNALKKLVISFFAVFLFVLPLTYLAAETFSLRKEIAKLRGLYPQFTDDEIAVVSAVKKAEDAVISIVVRKEVFSPSEKLLDLGNGFQIIVPGDLKSQGKQVVGQGSGFVVREDGLIVTNKHVVSDKKADYQVVFNSGKKYNADIVATDPVNDLALLKIKGSSAGFHALALGNSDELRIGQTVIAIGNALGEMQNSVTKGVVSGMNRAIFAADEKGGQTERLVKIIQTDAAINPGNSGGPLLSASGEVVGINTAVSRGAENIGFAIPANDIKFVLENYEKNGRIVRPFVGVRYSLITPEIKKQLNIPYGRGVLLVEGGSGEPAVAPDSPAARAGLAAGDIILEVNGVRLDENNELAVVVRDFRIGQEISLKVWKKSSGTVVQIKVALAELK